MRRTRWRRRSTASLVAVATISSLMLAACGGSDDDKNSSAIPSSAGPCGTTDDITLTVGLFGTMGFKENGLWDAYQEKCPNITIQEDVVEQSADYWTRLKTRLASGSGLADVQAIEVGFVADVVQNHADEFVNWNDVPEAADLKAEFFPWKWSQATTPDGSTTVGLGTDIGPEAICYRSDLLEQAGLPSTPDEVAAAIGTWEDFIAFGQEYESSATKTDRLALRRLRGEHLLHGRLPGRARLRRRRRPGRRRGQRRRGRTPGSTPCRPRRTASPPASSSSPRTGTRRSPPAASRPSPARPG